MKIRVSSNFVSAMILTVIGTTSLLPAQQVTATHHTNEPLKAYLRSYLSLGGKVAPDTTTRITVANVRNDDGKTEEDIVYVSGQDWCGSGGCTMLILAPSGSSFKLLGKETIVQLPVRLLQSMRHGYPDIGVLVQGGGILSGYEAVLSFNGKRYPSNPSMPPAQKIMAARGKVIIATTNNSVPLWDY